MTAFLSITSFRNQLNEMLSFKRGVYSGLSEEICDAFNGVSMNQIRQNRDMILMADDEVVIKLRLPDRKMRLSKSNGYRLIYLAMKHEDIVAFLDVYPKRGPLQKLDEDDREILRLTSEFLNEMMQETIVEHDIVNSLAIIKP
ncbi:MAG: hypothetical protein KBT27_15735 [Prevotellaceae bacterium]|nr:hypothetical protein [Candidatus Faecinaster equi]